MEFSDGVFINDHEILLACQYDVLLSDTQKKQFSKVPVCRVDAPEQFPSLFMSGEFRRNIYLTAKEALHNVVKHAQAQKVHVLIRTGDALYVPLP